MRNFNLYIDADGVLADFDKKVIEIFGKPVSSFDKGKFWAMLSKYDAEVEKFFRNLPKCDGADQLVKFATDNFNHVTILTAAGYTPKDASQQKQEWFAEHYPGLKVICVAKSPDKAQYASWDSILIDDRSKSIDPWVAKGGNGILHRNVPDTIEQLKAYL